MKWVRKKLNRWLVGLISKDLDEKISEIADKVFDEKFKELKKEQEKILKKINYNVVNNDFKFNSYDKRTTIFNKKFIEISEILDHLMTKTNDE